MYLCDGLSADEGCDAAVTARTRCWWVRFRGFGELQYGKRFFLTPKGAANKNYVQPALLY